PSFSIQPHRRERAPRILKEALSSRSSASWREPEYHRAISRRNCRDPGLLFALHDVAGEKLKELTGRSNSTAQAGLALVPLALSGGGPGSEIQTPMAIVILFGLLSSTALNMIVVQALCLRFGSALRVKEQRSAVRTATA
ncbi:MAG: hypothetical protein ACREU8_12105, partial [Gammaproteobacteria bacterium]